jgi:hypothetical protein
MPFWHKKLPFVMCTPVPDIYGVEGMSEVELIKDIQAAIWTFLNQRLDNTRLISNAIIMIRDTVDDPDKLIFEPGAVWPVADPQEVQLWTPNMNIGQASLEAEAELKSDLLNLTGAMQYLGGSSPDEMQNDTATGVSLMSNSAQGRVLSKRQRVFDAVTEFGDQAIQLNQQLWRGPIDIRLPGTSKDQPYSFQTVHAQDILCNCCYFIESATESMNRAEKRNEAMQLFATFMPLIMPAAQLGTKINIGQMIDFVLHAFDIKNSEIWYASMPDQGAEEAPPAGAPPMAPPPPNGQGMLLPAGGNAQSAPPAGLASLVPGLSLGGPS